MSTMEKIGYRYCLLLVIVGMLCFVRGILAVEYLIPFAWYSGDVRVDALTEDDGGWIQLKSEPRQNLTADVRGSGWAGVLRLNASLGVGTGIENKSILVNVSEHVASVYVSTSYNSFSPLPVSALGDKYIVSTCISPGDTTVLVIATHGQATEVAITLKLEGSISYGGKTYSDGDTLTSRLEQYQTLTIKTDFDLTGTVVSTTQTVAVFIGTMSSHYVVSYDQLLPVKHYGQKYIFAVDDNPSMYLLQIVSEYSDTQVVFSNGSTISVGVLYRQNLTQNETLYFSTTRPVMTLLCRKSAIYSGVTLVPPVPLYITQSTLYTRYQDTLKVMVRKDVTDVQMRVSYSTSKTLSWEDVPDTAYRVGTWRSDVSFDRVSLTTNINFTVLLFQDIAIRNCSYAFLQRAALEAEGSTRCLPAQYSLSTYLNKYLNTSLFDFLVIISSSTIGTF